MAITQVGTTTTAGSGSTATTVVCSKPTGTASGNLLMALVTCHNLGTVTGPSGWTEKFTAATANDFKTSLWTKVAGGSEPSTYTWTETVSGTQRFAVSMTAWTGQDSAADPIGSNYNVTQNTTTTAAQTTPSVTSTHARGRIFYMRAARVGSSTQATYTSGLTTELTDYGSTTSSISYSHAWYPSNSSFSSAGTFGGVSITASSTVTDNVMATWTVAEPIQGDFDGVQLGNVTMDFAGNTLVASGPMAMQLSGVTQDFAGVASPPSGDITMQLNSVSADFAGISDQAGGFALQLGNVTADFAGQIINGSFALQLNSVTADFAGAVNPAGDMGMQLGNVTMAFGSETVPFGEHVIRVEAESRAFRVIDEDPGLVDIPRSQVTDL